MGTRAAGPAPIGGWPPHTLLGGLAERSRERLLRLGTAQQFGSGETIIAEGDDQSRQVYALLDATVKVVGNTADGQSVLLAIRAGGDLIGELACLDGRPRVATVVAVRPCVVRRIGQAEFLDFLAADPAAALAVSRSVAAKLRNSTWHRIEFGGSPAPVRLARLLVQLAAAHGEPHEAGVRIGVALTQPDLAALVGAKEPTVQKVLRALRADGVIETGYRRVVIRDPAALHAVAGITEIPPEYGVQPAVPPQDGRRSR